MKIQHEYENGDRSRVILKAVLDPGDPRVALPLIKWTIRPKKGGKQKGLGYGQSITIDASMIPDGEPSIIEATT